MLSQGSNNTSSQSLSQWPTSNPDSQTDGQNQEPKTAQQEQHSSEMEPKQHGSLGEHLQHVASQDVNNPHLSQKQSQDDCHQAQAPAVQVPLHNSQTIGIQNSVKDSVLNNEVVKSHNPSSESQYAKLQQMSNQQATVSEQPSSQVNRSKQVPFGLLLPILLPQLAKDRAMQLQTLFAKLKVCFPTNLAIRSFPPPLSMASFSLFDDSPGPAYEQISHAVCTNFVFHQFFYFFILER